MKFFSDWKATRWDFVEKIANNDLARVVGLVPLIGYLILFNDEIADIITFRTIAGAQYDSISPFFLSSIVKLRLVFFGSLFVFLANIIFKLFSPKELQLSKGDLEFSTRVRDSYSVHELKIMEDQVFSDQWKPRLSIFWKVLDSIRAKKAVVSGFRPDVRTRMFSEHGGYIHVLAREWWLGMMHTFRVARVASLFLGVAGYLMLAVPTADIAQAVICDVVSSLWLTVIQA